MKCPSCQAENKQGAKFCVKCGAALMIQPLTAMPKNQPTQTQSAIGNITKDKKRRLMIIAIIILLIGGGYFWFSRNSTREIAGEWQLTEENGKRVGKNDEMLMIDNRGALTVNIPAYLKITGLKVRKEKSGYKLDDSEEVRIKATKKAGDGFKEACQLGFLTKVSGNNYRLSTRNIDKITELNSRKTDALENEVENSSVWMVLANLNIFYNEDMELVKTSDGKLEKTSSIYDTYKDKAVYVKKK